MKLKAFFLAALLSPLAANAAVTFVGQNNCGYCESITRTTTVAGNDLILIVIGFESPAGETISTVTDSTGATVITDYAFVLGGSPLGGLGFGVYRVHSATAVAHELTVTWSGTAPSTPVLYLAEASGVVAYDSAAGTPSIANGTGTTITSGSLTPRNNGELLLSAALANVATSGFVPKTGFTMSGGGAVNPTWNIGYLNQATAASVDFGATISTSGGWGTLMVAYTDVSIGSNPAGFFFGHAN